MEAHPPFLLPVGHHPPGQRTAPSGLLRFFASIGARTIPLAPFLSAGRVIIRGDTPSAPAKGRRPLDSCCDSELRLDRGSHHPPGPLPFRKGGVKKSSLWRHILHSSCQWGCTPLDSLLAPAKGRRPLDSCCDSELRLDRGSHHPPGPLPFRKGGVKKSSLWRHILHSSCQWGCTPLDSPLARAVVRDRTTTAPSLRGACDVAIWGGDAAPGCPTPLQIASLRLAMTTGRGEGGWRCAPQRATPPP